MMKEGKMPSSSTSSEILICPKLLVGDAMRCEESVVVTLTFFNVRTPASWSLDAWGLKSTLPLDTIKLFFELVKDTFILEMKLKKLKMHMIILRKMMKLTYVVR